MHNPIAVFDTGIGSYSIVRRIREKFPKQDIVYLADRASFPYGAKTREELLACVDAAIRFLNKEFSPSSIVVASNAPSVLVLDELRSRFATPLIGVYPPIEAAERISKTGHIGILGVQSLVTSKALRDYLKRTSANPNTVFPFNASPLVALVESGAFLHRLDEAKDAVKTYMQNVRRQQSQIDTCTLSSTHLPWLEEFFRETSPDICFVDPADNVVANINSAIGSGNTLTLVTESSTYTIADFERLLRALHLDLDPQRVCP